MSEACYPVVVETPHGQVQADFCVRASDGPHTVAETLRNAGGSCSGCVLPRGHGLPM